MEKVDEILEVVSFLKERIVSIEETMATKGDLELAKAELKRDIHGLLNRLDDELDKRKVLEVRVGKLEQKMI